MSMGGAFTAVADDYSAAYYNPAGLSQIDGDHFDFSYIYTAPKIDVTKDGGGALKTYDSHANVRTDPTKAESGNGLNMGIPLIGLVLDINRIIKLKPNLQLGLAISMPESMDVSYRIHDYPPDQPHFIRYGDDIDRITIIAGLGLEAIKDLLHVGAGVQAMLYGNGKFYIDNPQVISTSQEVVSQAEFNAKFQFEPTAGILFTPLDKQLKIGFSWKDRQELKLDPIPAITSIDIGYMKAGVPMIIDICAYFNPMEFSLGASYDIRKIPLMVSLQVDKQRWSQYRYSTTDSYHYLDGGPNFKDTYNWRLGLEYKLNKDWTFTGGYNRQPSPVPDQSGRVSNYIDMNKNIFSLGANYNLKDPFNIMKQPMKLSAFVQYQALQSLHVNKDGVTGITWLNEDGKSNTEPSYSVKGSAIAGGLSFSAAW